MSVVSFFIPSRIAVLPLALLGAGGAGLACRERAEMTTSTSLAEKPAERELNWNEQPLGGVAAMAAEPVLVRDGPLPLVYMSEQRQTIQVIDRTSDVVLAELPVARQSIVRVDARGGVGVGKDTLYYGPLDPSHEYGIFVVPDDVNVSRSGSYQPVPNRNPAVPETGE